ncbi:cytochrome P450 [Microlunatus speluncae]|uniref:cytochrome P450 n=1 Tax=Microlunatus speluncae TaxID=2594267 RepID=UPI001FEA7242|nr:cytochrome P450 [Microlunatus speluncae]
MSVRQTVEGGVRDAVRAAAMAGLRARGDVLGQLMSPKMITDPYPTYRRLREQGPVVETAMGAISLRYAICGPLLRHPSTVTGTSMRREITAGTGKVQQWLFGSPSRDGLVDPTGPDSMISKNPPDHTRLRKLVSKVFTPASIGALRPRLTEIAAGLVDRARTADSFDLMRDVAGVFPVLAICEILAIPQPDHERFRQWGSDLAADLDAMAPAARQRAANASLEALQGYFVDLVAARRQSPGDDLVSGLIAVEEEGERLTTNELLATCMLLLFAGFETTVNLIGNGALALIQNQDQLRLLRDDHELIPGAVEELLRFDPPIQLSSRVPTIDIEIDGTVLPAGRPVSLMLAGANRDPEVFTDPDRLDVTRANARKHLSFAAGPHHCLGAALARLEAEIMFRLLLERLGDLRPAGEPRRRPTFVLRGLTSLPLHS